MKGKRMERGLKKTTPLSRPTMLERVSHAIAEVGGDGSSSKQVRAAASAVEEDIRQRESRDTIDCSRFWGGGGGGGVWIRPLSQ